jgi:hypothetical protein
LRLRLVTRLAAHATRRYILLPSQLGSGPCWNAAILRRLAAHPQGKSPSIFWTLILLGGRATPATHLMTPTVWRAAAGTRSVARTTRNAAPTTRNAAFLTGTATIPARIAIIPARDVTLPDRIATTPTRNATYPVRIATIPARNAAFPARIAIIPARNVTFPTRNVAIPTRIVTIRVGNAATRVVGTMVRPCKSTGYAKMAQRVVQIGLFCPISRDFRATPVAVRNATASWTAAVLCRFSAARTSPHDSKMRPRTTLGQAMTCQHWQNKRKCGADAPRQTKPCRARPNGGLAEYLLAIA